MKTSLLLISLLFMGFQAISQKIKIDDDIAYVDGEAYVKWQKQTMANEASIMALDSDSEEIFMSFQDYIDPNKVSSSNPDGKVRWIELNFLTLGLKCEVASNTHKAIVKLLYENKIYVNGSLDTENAQKFILKYGTKFTDNNPNRRGNVNIIINN